MMIELEKAIQKSTTRNACLSVHHTSFLWALLHGLVLSTTHRFVAPRGEGLREQHKPSNASPQEGGPFTQLPCP